MPHQFLKPLSIITAISMCSWILFRIIANVVKRKHGKGFFIKSELILLAVYIYIVSVMTLTVIPLPFTSSVNPNKGGINITPVKYTIMGLAEIFIPEKSAIEKTHTLENVFGNILMFIPLGMFLPFLSGKFCSLQRVTLFAMICSVSIETTQLISRLFEIYRYVDIDDVLLNTAGAALGFIIVNRYFGKPGNARITLTPGNLYFKGSVRNVPSPEFKKAEP